MSPRPSCLGKQCHSRPGPPGPVPLRLGAKLRSREGISIDRQNPNPFECSLVFTSFAECERRCLSLPQQKTDFPHGSIPLYGESRTSSGAFAARLRRRKALKDRYSVNYLCVIVL